MEMPKALNPEPQDAIAVAITVSTQVSDKRSIVMQTYMPRDAAIEDFNATVDKLTAVVDRQETKYRLIDLRVSLSVHEGTLKQLEADFLRIDARAAADWQRANKKGEPKLSANEEAQKTTAKQNILRYKLEIEKVKAEITVCEATLKGD